MSVQFRDSEKSLSATLIEVSGSIDGESVTLRRLFELIGEQGLLLFCMFLTIPFLIPVSIPGVSTIFGLAIILIGVGILLNRLPWLPSRLMERELKTADLKPAFERGAQIFARLDRVIRPRLPFFTQGALAARINGGAIIFAGVLLMAPLGLIPFSNTLPALAILFLAVGILQGDGVFILLGYVMIVATLIYFGFLAVGAILAGQGISSLIGSGYAPLIALWW